MKSKLLIVGAMVVGFVVGGAMSGLLSEWIWQPPELDAELELWLNGKAGEELPVDEGNVVRETLLYRELLEKGEAVSEPGRALCEKLKFSGCGGVKAVGGSE